MSINNLINNLKNPEIRAEISNNIKQKQKDFLESTLGQIINNGIDIGIRAVLPDWLEDEFIEMKDMVLNEGFKEGLQIAINKTIDVGKAMQGIVTGNFESIEQVKIVIEKGGLLDTVSKLLDNVIKWAKDKKVISSKTAKLLKSSKKTILQAIEDNIDTSLTDQVASLEKIESYIEKWTNYYKEQDLTNMKKIHTRMTNELEKVLPIQSTLEKVEEINNLHELIINNGGDFNLTEEELELSAMLVY